MTDTDTKVREAVGVFHDEKSLLSAVDGLLIDGFDRSHLSLLAGQKTVESKLGRQFEKVGELEDNPTVPTTAFVGVDSRTEAKGVLIGGLFYVGACASVGMIVASGGTMAAALAAVAVGGGAGGLIGAALARIVDRRHAQRLQEQLEHGGLLLWVRTPDAEHERRAVEILRRQG